MATNVLGDGALSSVHLVGGHAVKVTRKELLAALRAVDGAVREVEVLRACADAACRSLPLLHEAAQDGAAMYLRMDAVLASADGGRSVNLTQLRRAQPGQALVAPCAVALAACMADALSQLHARGIAHRDVKSENVCVRADGTPVLIDFGCARLLASREARSSEVRSSSLVGTLGYMAPEMLSRRGHGCAVDWWSLGATAFELVAARAPFGDARSHAELGAAQEEALRDGAARMAQLVLAATTSPARAEVCRGGDVGASEPASASTAVAGEGCSEHEAGRALASLLHGVLVADEVARAEAALAWLGAQDVRARCDAARPQLLVALAAAASSGLAATTEGEEDDDEEEATLAAEWALAEREELAARGEALWRSSAAAAWRAALEEAYGGVLAEAPEWAPRLPGRVSTSRPSRPLSRPYP